MIQRWSTINLISLLQIYTTRSKASKEKKSWARVKQKDITDLAEQKRQLPNEIRIYSNTSQIKSRPILTKKWSKK